MKSSVTVLHRAMSCCNRNRRPCINHHRLTPVCENPVFLSLHCRYKTYAEGYAWSVSLKYNILSRNSVALINHFSPVQKISSAAAFLPNEIFCLSLAMIYVDPSNLLLTGAMQTHLWYVTFNFSVCINWNHRID